MAAAANSIKARLWYVEFALLYLNARKSTRCHVASTREYQNQTIQAASHHMPACSPTHHTYIGSGTFPTGKPYPENTPSLTHSRQLRGGVPEHSCQQLPRAVLSSLPGFRKNAY